MINFLIQIKFLKNDTTVKNFQLNVKILLKITPFSNMIFDFLERLNLLIKDFD